jgi:hypothetical protein
MPHGLQMTRANTVVEGLDTGLHRLYDMQRLYNPHHLADLAPSCSALFRIVAITEEKQVMSSPSSVASGGTLCVRRCTPWIRGLMLKTREDIMRSYNSAPTAFRSARLALIGRSDEITQYIASVRHADLAEIQELKHTVREVQRRVAFQSTTDGVRVRPTRILRRLSYPR